MAFDALSISIIIHGMGVFRIKTEKKTATNANAFKTVFLVTTGDY